MNDTEEYRNSCKGHQGFVKKYKVLGNTTHIRVPVTIKDKIKRIIELLDSVAVKEGINKTDTILDKVIKGLENNY